MLVWGRRFGGDGYKDVLAEEAKLEPARGWEKIEDVWDEGVAGLPSSFAAVTEVLDKARGNFCTLYALIVGSQI